MFETEAAPPLAEVDRCLSAARAGSRDALGQLWETCRQYLLHVANEELHKDVQAKVAPSDVVQETFLEAQRGFARFHGQTEADLLAWLRCILLRNVANAHRCFRQTQKRSVTREVILGGEGETELPAPAESPSAVLAAREQDVALGRALGRLPDHYRQVIHWRNYERLDFEEIGRRLGRSAEAARKVWGRAIEQLQLLLEPADDA